MPRILGVLGILATEGVDVSLCGDIIIITTNVIYFLHNDHFSK